MNKKEQCIILRENIKYLRRKYKLTQKKMAEICHISVSYLRKIERNELPPRLGVKTVFFLTAYFKLLPKQLFYPLFES